MHDRPGDQAEPTPTAPQPDAASMRAFGAQRPQMVSNGMYASHWHLEPLPDIPGYRITGIAGVGGLGVVFDAEQEHPRRRVAIKVIRPELVADKRLRESVLRRFESEVAHASRLHHPFILPVYEAGFFGKGEVRLPYLAMEFLDAPSVLAYAAGIDRHAHREHLLELLAKVAEGVHYAHLNGVIHRDLKPSNVVVRDNGLPAIRDFSLAWSHPQDLAGSERLTVPGTIACTFDYAAPEQLDATEVIGPAADLYALGVIAYELLLGNLPYDVDRSNLASLVSAIGEGRQVWNRHTSMCFGPDLAAVLRRSIQPRASDRYTSAEVFADDLRRVTRGDRPSARRASAMDDFQRFAHRNRTAVVAATLLLVAVAGGTAATLWQASVASANAATAEERSLRLAAFADRVVMELVGMAERMPTGTEARSKLLDEGVKTLEAIAAERDTDPSITDSLAGALIQLAQVAGDPSRANLGDADRAARCARRAIDLWQGIPGFDASPRLQSRVAHTYVVLAKILASSSNRDALSAAWEGHTRCLKVMANDPTESVARSTSSYALQVASILDVDSQRERLHEALQRNWQALDVACQRASASTPDQALMDSDAYEALAAVAMTIGRSEDAEALLAASEQAARPLADRGVPDALQSIANLGRARARVCLLAGDAEGEWTWRKKVRAEFADLVVRFPNRGRLLISHLLVAHETAECAVRLGIDADAATADSIAIRRAFYERDRTNESARAALEESLVLRRDWLANRDPEGAAIIDRELGDLRPIKPPTLTSQPASATSRSPP